MIVQGQKERPQRIAPFEKFDGPRAVPGRRMQMFGMHPRHRQPGIGPNVGGAVHDLAVGFFVQPAVVIRIKSRLDLLRVVQIVDFITQVGPLRIKMRLADVHRLVTGVAQTLHQRVGIMPRHPVLIPQPAGVIGTEAGDQRRPRGDAARAWRVRRRERHRIFRKLRKKRRLDDRMAQVFQAIRSPLIGKKPQYVGAFGGQGIFLFSKNSPKCMRFSPQIIHAYFVANLLAQMQHVGTGHGAIVQ